jgi:uncharacterized protein (DUF1015 family)
MKELSQHLEEAISSFSGFLLSRVQMPQIDDIEDFKTFLYENDIRFVSIRLELDNFLSKNIFKPTQTDYDENKVDRIVADLENKNLDEVKPVIFSEDGYVLDGHHRYYAAKKLALTRPHSKFPILKVNLPINKLLVSANQYQES